ncbi:CycB3 family protein [Megaselia abdita]
MAPTKSLRSTTLAQSTTLLPNLARRPISKRTQNIPDQNQEVAVLTRGKRKADNTSPLRNDKVKRSALGNLTNNVVKNGTTDDDPKQTLQHNVQCNQKIKKEIFAAPVLPKTTTTRVTRSKKPEVVDSVVSQKVEIKKEIESVPKIYTRRISNEFNKTEDGDSLYLSALDISTMETIRLSGKFDPQKRSTLVIKHEEPEEEEEDSTKVEEDLLTIQTPSPLKQAPRRIPPGVNDFDKENWNEPFSVSNYAMDIFEYLKGREHLFPIHDYMDKQKHLTKWMRSLLVDWIVEVQETFELNHETVYLAVKLVDIYLCKTNIHKDKLQLLGAAALFIACKYDERTTPVVEDFLYICDGAYVHDELIKMEIEVLKTIGFDLGIPLSYRFLRRYTRCAKIPMPTLTLARYILEYSLMDYATISLSDSKMACAALIMALRMSGIKKPWTPTLVHYTGYNIEDFKDIVPILNAGLHKTPRDTIKTIRIKYSHKVFHEVAKIPLLTNEQILKH